MARLTQPLTSRLAAASIRAFCHQAVRRIDLHVEGLDNVPSTGPAILAARHFHHFYDGCALIALVPPPLHLLVTLDWVHHPAGLELMRAACQRARWPVVTRTPSPIRGHVAEHRRPLPLAATRQCVDLLRAGKLLLVFPEGYPTIDPIFTPKTHDDDVLAFQPGFLRIAALAERDGLTHVPIIPTGLEYTRGVPWLLTVRFGRPFRVAAGRDVATDVAAVEQQVRFLSGLSGRPAVQRQTGVSGTELAGSRAVTRTNPTPRSPTQRT